jgi:hypothetical protein
MININLDFTGVLLVFIISVILWGLSIFKSSSNFSDVFISLFFTIAVLISFVWLMKLLVL